MAARAQKLGRAERAGTPASTAATIASRGPGQPLAAPERHFFEQRFASDFSGVRVHADDRAGAEANALGARAFTSGNDIVFAPGAYRPHGADGRALIAHELTHVAQQRNGRQEGMSRPGEAAEQEAATVAERVGAGGEAGPVRAAAPALARAPEPGGSYIEFEVGTDSEGNTVLNSVDVTDNPLWIDKKITAAGYNIWLGGFLIWLDEASIGDPAKGIKVPEADVNFTDPKARSINNFIYNSRADANAAVAAMPKRTDGALPFAYYWGAGGLLVVPTVICSATAPNATATMWQARVAYSKFVTDALTGVAIGMGIGRVLGGLYKWARGGGGGGVPKPPKGGKGDPKPPATTKPPQPAPAKTDPAKPAAKADPAKPEPAKPAVKAPAGDVPKNGPDLFTKTAQQPGGQADKVKYFEQQVPGLKQRTGWSAGNLGKANDGSVVFHGEAQSKVLVITPKGEVYTGNFGRHVKMTVTDKKVGLEIDWSLDGWKKW